MGLKFNPFTGNFDIDTTGGSSGSSSIEQYDTDPVAPDAETAWVLRTAGAPGNPAGSPVGLLLAITSPGTADGADTYQFSYQTLEGTIKRTSIS